MMMMMNGVDGAWRWVLLLLEMFLPKFLKLAMMNEQMLASTVVVLLLMLVVVVFFGVVMVMLWLLMSKLESLPYCCCYS